MSTEYTYQSKTKKVLIFLSVSLIYFCLGWGSLKLATINDFASPIWSPSGFAVGALILFGSWLTPAIFVGAFATNLLVTTSFTSLLGISTGNMLEAMVGAAIIGWIMDKASLKIYSEFVALVAASTLASMVSATFGVSTLLLSGLISPENFGYAWYTWWSGDAVGILIILPVFFEIYLSKNKKISSLSLNKILAAILFTSFFLLITYLVFVKGLNPAFSWIMCPFLTMAGIYLDRFISRAILIAVGILIIILTNMGYSPFEFGSLNLNLIYVQSLLLSYAFAVLFVRPLSADFKPGRTYILANILGWLSVFGVIIVTSELEKENMINDYKTIVQTSLSELKKTSDQCELLLEGGASLLKIKPNLTPDEWNFFQRSINLETRFNIIRGLAYVRYVEKSDLNTLKEYDLKTFDENYSKGFTDRFILTYVANHQNNQSIGLDLGSERHRRAAAEKARLTNRPVATEVIQLFNDGKKQDAFIVFFPIKSDGGQFKGWTFTPIVAETFFSKVFEQNEHLLKLKVSRHGKILYDTFSADGVPINPNYIKEIKVNIFGLDYTLLFYPKTSFFQRHAHSSAPLALLMSLLMLFIAGFLLEQLTFTQRTDRLIQIRTKELQDSKIQLINSSKMASLGEMASSMAHEINNPITIILGKLKVIRSMMEDLGINNPPLMDEIGRIEHSTGRISKIVKGLKSFSREAQEDPFELIPLESIVEETLDLCAERLKANGIKLTIEAIPQVCIYCRPSQISQVLLNMINNSSDALMAQHEKYIKIEFEIKEPDRIFIAITDSGPGIPAEISARIMEPFFTTKNVGKGTGLGLSIAKGIIEDHGGSIQLDEKSPHTRFIIELPLKNVSLKK